MSIIDTKSRVAGSSLGILLLFAMLMALPQKATAQEVTAPRALDAQGTMYNRLSDIPRSLPTQQVLLQAQKTAAADVILNQPLGMSPTLAVTSANGAFSVADDFTLTESKIITEVELYNIYFDFNTGGPIPAVDDFTVIFHEDAGGLPGAAISTEGGLATTRVDTGQDFVGLDIYKHTFSITPVALGPGTYWIEIFDTFPEPTFSLWVEGEPDPVVGGPDNVQGAGTPGSGWAATGISDVAVILRGVSEADLYVHKYQTIDDYNKEVEYHVVIENLGPSDATGVEALDDLPAGVTVTGWSTTHGTFDPSTGIWAAGDMANGTTAEMWIYGTFDAEGRYTNSVSVSGDQDDPDLDNNYAEVSFVVTGDRIVPDFVPGGAAGGIVDRGNRFTADLMLTKVADNTTPAVGDDVVWTITVTNQGPQSTAKVEVTDTPDSCLAPVGATASQGSFDTSTFIWDVGKIKVGDSATLEVITTITADCTGEVANTAEVTASSLPDPDDQFNLFDDPPVEDEIDTEIVTVTPNSRAVTLDGTTFALGTNYPNPFNPTTMIPFSVAEASFVSIKVYDLLGRTVSTLVDGTLSAGVHEVQFEASQLPTGMYIVRMEAGGIVKTQRVTLMK